MDKMQKKYFIFGILLLLSFGYFLNKCGKRITIREESVYPGIEKTNQTYNGKIASRSISKVLKDAYLLELSSGQKFRISGFSFLKIGDSICRPMNSDPLFIYTKDKKYCNKIK